MKKFIIALSLAVASGVSFQLSASEPSEECLIFCANFCGISPSMEEAIQCENDCVAAFCS